MLVERQDERLRFLITIQQKHIAVDHRRCTLAECVPFVKVGWKRFLPFEIALEVVGEDTTRPEVGVEHLAVGHWGVRGEAAILAMVALVRCGHHCCSLPDLLSGGSVESQHDKGMLTGRRPEAAKAAPAPSAAAFTVASSSAAGVTAALAFALGHQAAAANCVSPDRGSASGCRHDPGLCRNRGSQEDTITPDHGSRVSLAGDLHSPLYVFAFTELSRGTPVR